MKTRKEIIADHPLLAVCQRDGMTFRRKGEEHYAPCRFHEDGKRPNFRVNVEKQLWHCDVCGIGGSVIDYVAKRDTISIPDALKKLGKNGASEPGQKPKIVKTYSYTDEKGAELYQVCRMEPKTFRQRHSEGGQWVWKMDGVRRVLYNLPALITSSTVWIVEGEKDADTLNGLGLVATCNVGGAGKWRDEYSEHLQGKEIIVIPDNDKAGRDHVATVTQSLAGKAKSIEQVVIPSPHKDTTDFIKSFTDADKGKAALLDLAEKASTAPKVDPYAYFDAGRNCYWLRNDRGGWISVNETQVKRHLKQGGVSPKVPEGSYVSPLDNQLIEIQQKADVHYAGALAGYATGVYDIGERRVLVTESPRIIEPMPGDWPTLRAFIDGLLHDPLHDQQLYFFGWLKIAFEALRAGERRPGQSLVLAGVRDCGKSLLQNLVTIILGGRSARPYQFMSGLTPFNSDLFEAEHLMIEDDQASTDIRARRNFGAQIKNITVNDGQRCHAKNRVAISLAPFWRLSVTVNDEPENLMVLPPIDDSIEDKLIILRASLFTMPMPTATLEQRKAYWQKLVDELPAFLHHLTQWEIPETLLSDRFGITHFHHPEILNAIDSLAPEFRLLRLIDDELFQTDAAGAWTGSAEQLERTLCADDSRCRNEACKLFTFTTACGVYLARLHKKYPERFEYDRNSARRVWTIHPE